MHPKYIDTYTVRMLYALIMGTGRNSTGGIREGDWQSTGEAPNSKGRKE